MTGLAVVITGQDKSGAAIASAGGGVQGFGSKLKGLLAIARDVTIVGGGVAKVFRTIGRAISSTAAATAAAVKEDVKLASALASTGQEVRKNLKELSAWADARQKATGIDDEATKSLLAQGTQLGVTGEKLKGLVAGAQDFSAMFGQDATMAISQFISAAHGGENRLKRFGIEIDKTASFAENLDKIIRLTNRGLSEGVGSLPTSAFTHLANVFGDLKESIGLLVVETKTFRFVMNFARDMVAKFKDALATGEVKEWAAAFDGAAVKVLKAARMLAVGIFDLFFVVVQGIAKAQLAFNLFSGEAGSDAQRLANEMAAAKPDIEAFFNSIIEGIEKTPSLDRLGDSFEGVIRSLEGRQGATWSDLGAEAGRVYARTFAEVYREEMAILTEEQMALGHAYTSAMTQGMIASLDEEVGIQEAWSRLGDDARNAFVGQMSSALFSPLKQSFGQLAQALAQPFALVGQAVNDLIVKPVVNFVTNLIGQILSSIGLVTAQQTAATTSGAVAGAAAIATLSGSVAAMLPVLGAAAAAAAIASYGTALAYGPLAIGEMASAKAAALALAVPGADEGALIMPRSGHPEGRLLRVAETHPEWVLSTEQAQRRFGGGGGGRGGDTFITHIAPKTLTLSDRESERQAERLARDSMGQIRRSRIGGRSRV